MLVDVVGLTLPVRKNVEVTLVEEYNKCPECCTQFENNESLTSHVEQCGISHFACTICSKISFSADARAIHTARCHGEPQNTSVKMEHKGRKVSKSTSEFHRCHYCLEVFEGTKKYSRTTHEADVHKVPSTLCRFDDGQACPLQITLNGIRKHVKSHHAKEEAELTTSAASEEEAAAILAKVKRYDIPQRKPHQQ